MASNLQDSVQQLQPSQTLQIYSSSNNGVSPFWREKYEKDAKKYWDIFYKRHQDKFFKDRHYLDKEWGHYFSERENKVILEVGCGAGNTIFPLIATYPDIFVHACDFSPRAVNLVKSHKEFTETRVSAFVCDPTTDDLTSQIAPSSVDIVTMIFVLSAASPEKMPLMLQNIKKVLKPNGYVLFRDYAVGDLAQERLIGKDQMISENFYVRGDGTRAFYFSNEFLTSLFEENGFDVEELGVCCKQVENRSRELVMNRRWVQAAFRLSNDIKSPSSVNGINKVDQCDQTDITPTVNTSHEPVNGLDIDMSEGLAFEMFGGSPSNSHEFIDVKVENFTFKIKVLSNEYQHTCKSTGLMLWQSARLMAYVLAKNPSIVAGKRVLELGCGGTGVCSMVAAESANLVIATDGDTKALDLLTQNVTTNLGPQLLRPKLITKILEWGNKDHIESIKNASDGGFEVIMGTDVTYIATAILPLFETARDLITSSLSESDGEQEPALILCHVLRRVDEPSILSAASMYGFRLVDKWSAGVSTNNTYGNIIGRWFSEIGSDDIPSSALNIMYFQSS